MNIIRCKFRLLKAKLGFFKCDNCRRSLYLDGDTTSTVIKEDGVEKKICPVCNEIRNLKIKIEWIKKEYYFKLEELRRTGKLTFVFKTDKNEEGKL